MRDNGRIVEHPVMPSIRDRQEITIFFNGTPVTALEGESVAAALTAAGIRVFRYTHKKHEPRGIFCAIGHCTDCVMTIDDVPDVKTCQTRVRDGMRIERKE
ncbi:MAG: (2Fe-2S)-binding protein [Lachnospiraceae bacterium]|nr:(2Fe-2S)-binding protein [Lachnospiraceae bacterium]